MENKIWIFCAIFTWKVLGKSDGSWLRGVHSKLGKNDITHYADIYSRQSSFRQLILHPLKGEDIAPSIDYIQIQPVKVGSMKEILPLSPS